MSLEQSLQHLELTQCICRKGPAETFGRPQSASGARGSSRVNLEPIDKMHGPCRLFHFAGTACRMERPGSKRM